jgi:catalase
MPKTSSKTSTGKRRPIPPSPAGQERQAVEVQALAAAIPFNANKPNEIGRDNALAPSVGQRSPLTSASTGAGTLSEANDTGKTGEGGDDAPSHEGFGSLQRVRADAGGEVLTTNQGVAVGDNQNSLKAGLRGPTLLEDFIPRENSTLFDH